MRRLKSTPPAKDRRKTPPRRRPPRRDWRPILIYGGAALALALVAGWGTWYWRSGRALAAYERGVATLIEATASAGLVLREVYVTGRERTPRAAILAALDATEGSPLLRFDPAAAGRRLEAIGWVRSAVVERRFPGTVLVRLDERRPIARWQSGGVSRVIDHDGVVIKGVAAADFPTLPVVVGKDAPANTAGLLAVLATDPALGARVKAAIRVGGRRWNLRLDNGIEVRLPESDIADAWRRLGAYARGNRMLARAISSVDLRLPDRLVVRRAGDDDKRT